MKLLFFTPHTALWVHTVPEAYLARSLGELGHDVSYLTCGRGLSYCACMAAHQISPGSGGANTDAICDTCEFGAKTLHKVYGYPVDTLSAFIEPSDQQRCAELSRKAIAARSFDTELFGVPAGKLALYEFTLAHKKMSANLTESQWAEYACYLENALLALNGFVKFIESAKPDVMVTFSPQYSNINVCTQYALSQGIRVLFIESGTNLGHRLGTLRVWDWAVHRLVNPALKYWAGSENHKVSKTSAKSVTSHFRELLGGKSFAVYSNAYNGAYSVRDRYGILPHQRVVLLTLSSYDEAYAAFLIDAFPHDKVFSSVFKNQAEWVRETILWAESRPDIYLIIRVHPRDFPNKRESTASEQSLLLEEVLGQVAPNVHVNWPSEGISLYQILEDADLVVTGWSVTAMEALILGLPIVTYDALLPSYPKDIIFTGRSRDEYFANIDKALLAGWSFENVINGFRWLAYNFVDCTISVSNKYGQHELSSRNQLERVVTGVKLRVPMLGKPLDLFNWRGARKGAHTVHRMIEEGFDSIPATLGSNSGSGIFEDVEQATIVESLNTLHELLYKTSNEPTDKPGLSRNIRNFLVTRN